MKTSTLISPVQMKALREQHHDMCDVLSHVQKHSERNIQIGKKIHPLVSDNDVINGIRACIPHVLQVAQIEFYEGKPAERLDPHFAFAIVNIGFSPQTVILSLGIPDVWNSSSIVVLTIEPGEEGLAKFTVPMVVFGKLQTTFVLFQHFNLSRNYRLTFVQNYPTHSINDWLLSDMLDLS